MGVPPAWRQAMASSTNRLRGAVLPEGIQPKFISINQTCVLLGTGRTTVYRLLADGTIQSAKIGKSRKIDLASALAVGSGEAA